jgi:Xaa-Pro dipeptidase
MSITNKEGITVSTDAQTLTNDRNTRVLDLLTALPADHLLLGNADNIRYATNFRSLIVHETADHMLCLMNSDGQARVFGPHVRETADLSELPDVRIDAVHPLVGWVPLEFDIAAVVDVLSKSIANEGARRVGYDVLHPVILDGLRHELPRTDFVYVGAELFDLRRVKLPLEVALLEAAAEDNLAALNAAFNAARPGMTDREILAVAVGHQQKSNAELITHFSCNIRSGADWFPAGRTLREGDSIFIDQVYYGRGGYASDLTRTAFVGEPPAQVAHAYRRLVEIAHEIHAACKPGVSVARLDDLMMESLRKNGLPASPYGLGHGIGLRVMEPPSIISEGVSITDHVLRLGETIALEPETWVTYLGSRIPLKVEDCVVVGTDGGRPLGVPAPDELQVIAC